MRAEMRAIGIEQPRLAAFIAEQDEVAPEIMNRPDVADLQLGAIADPEPAIGDGHRKAFNLWHVSLPDGRPCRAALAG
jgi:hypothetical protein